MTDEQKQNLLPYFGWAYVSQNYKDETQDVTSAEQAQAVIEKHADEISEAASSFNDWDALAEQVETNEQDNSGTDLNTDSAQIVQSAKNGAKLEKINKLNKVKTAKCGCEMKTVKKGGKMVQTCVPKKGKTVDSAIDKMKSKGMIKAKDAKKNPDGTKSYMATVNKKKALKKKGK
jgi:hypothetical protein